MTRDVRHRSDAGETRFLIRFIDRYGPPGSGGPGLGASGAARTNRCDQFVAREANGYSRGLPSLEIESFQVYINESQ